MAQRQLHIPRARRQIDQQHVQLAPFHLIKHLLQRAHQHGAAPDDRLALLHHQAQRHDSDPMGVERLDHLAVAGRTLSGQAQHPGL
ncbi:hypothetical protein D9M69_698240 [compost metagenome]